MIPAALPKTEIPARTNLRDPEIVACVASCQRRQTINLTTIVCQSTALFLRINARIYGRQWHDSQQQWHHSQAGQTCKRGWQFAASNALSLAFHTIRRTSSCSMECSGATAAPARTMCRFPTPIRSRVAMRSLNKKTIDVPVRFFRS